jgi:hypothetical protein
VSRNICWGAEKWTLKLSFEFGRWVIFFIFMNILPSLNIEVWSELNFNFDAGSLDFAKFEDWGWAAFIEVGPKLICWTPKSFLWKLSSHWGRAIFHAEKMFEVALEFIEAKSFLGLKLYFGLQAIGDIQVWQAFGRAKKMGRKYFAEKGLPRAPRA